MKSLLFTTYSPFGTPPGCGLGRQESLVTIPYQGQLYYMTIRDKIVPEDPYLVMVKGGAYSVNHSVPYPATAPERSLLDFLVKNNVVI